MKISQTSIYRLLENLCLGLPLILASCTGNLSETEKKLASKYFFQASDFIVRDYQNQRKEHDLMKIITINNQSDTTFIRDSITPDELAMLNKYNLNNPHWIHEYDTDTTYGVYGEPDHYHYRAISEKLPVRNIDVYLSQGKVNTIKTVSQQNSLINKHHLSLNYTTGIGYDLVSVQKMWNGDTLRMHVHALFRKK